MVGATFPCHSRGGSAYEKAQVFFFFFFEKIGKIWVWITDEVSHGLFIWTFRILYQKKKVKNDSYVYLNLPLHIYGLFGPNCTFTMHGGIFVNKWTSLNNLFPRDNNDTNLAPFNSLLIDALLLECPPSIRLQLVGEMKERRISMPPSF